MRAFTKAIACALLGALLLARTAAATGRQLRSANKTRDGHEHEHDHDHGHGHSGVSCASAACKAAFQTVLMAHDSCNDEELPPLLETQLHFYEEACEAQLCNTIDAPYDLATQAAACDDDHDDDDHDNGHHHEPCVCVASAYGFEIDCSKPEVVDTAITYLKNNDCASNPSNTTCTKNFYILQSHHDFCPLESLSLEAKIDIHAVEEHFEDCEIVRQFNPELENCAPVDCADKTKLEHALNVLTSGQCSKQ